MTIEIEDGVRSLAEESAFEFPEGLPANQHHAIEGAVSWDGKDAGGAVVPDGTYSYTIRGALVRYDLLGNGVVKEKLVAESGALSGTVLVDSTPPEKPSLPPGEEEVVWVLPGEETVTLVVDVPDDVVQVIVEAEEPLAVVSVTMGQTPVYAEIDVTGLPAGAEADVTFTPVDAAGNEGEPLVRTVKAALPSPITVGPAGPPDYHFATIQNALNFVWESLPKDGPGPIFTSDVTIMVYPGTYVWDENCVRSYVANTMDMEPLYHGHELVIQGVADGAQVPVLDGEGVTGRGGFRVTAGLTLRGFEVRNCETGALLCTERATVEDCRFVDCGTGIYAWGLRHAISDNVCEGYSQVGISYYGHGPLMKDNVCDGKNIGDIGIDLVGMAVKVEDNVCRNNKLYGMKAFTTYPGDDVIGNTCEYNGSSGFFFEISGHMVFDGNVSFNNGPQNGDGEGSGFEFAGSGHLRVSNCVCAQNEGPAVKIYTDGIPPVFLVVNNTFVSSDYPVFDVDVSRLSAQRVFLTFKNNVMVAHGGECLRISVPRLVEQFPDWLQSDHNDLYPDAGGKVAAVNGQSYESLADWQAAFGQDENSTSADPLFVDEAGNDFHIQLGSPCVDEGTEVGAPSEDIEGNPRPQIHAYDMGAYELVYSLPQPGIVWAWGKNEYGQLGRGPGSPDESLYPIQVYEDDTMTEHLEAVAISGGYTCSLALRQDGTVRGWGHNEYRQLGIVPDVICWTPVVIGGIDRVISISAGAYYCLALRSNGEVWAWGHNMYGQLGNGTSGPGCDRHTPARVYEEESGEPLRHVTAISAGDHSSFALKADGTLWAWGNNANCELGTGDNNARVFAVPIEGLPPLEAIAAGKLHTLALTEVGRIYAWGFNSGYGGCGLPATTKYQTTPVEVTELQQVEAIAAGGHHSLALLATGEVWAWGYNFYGQLGDGTSGGSTNRYTPERVLEEDESLHVPLTDIVAIAVAVPMGYFNLALASDATVWSWGRGEDGALGSGDMVIRETADPVFESDSLPFTDVMKIACGGGHALAIRENQEP